MNDPAAALDAATYIRWRLQCIAAAQRGDPLPPMPLPRWSDHNGDGYTVHQSEALRQVIAALEEMDRHAQEQG